MINKIGLPKYGIPTYSSPSFQIPGGDSGNNPPEPGLPSAGFTENYQIFPLNNMNQRLI